MHRYAPAGNCPGVVMRDSFRSVWGGVNSTAGLGETTPRCPDCTDDFLAEAGISPHRDESVLGSGITNTPFQESSLGSAGKRMGKSRQEFLACPRIHRPVALMAEQRFPSPMGGGSSPSRPARFSMHAHAYGYIRVPINMRAFLRRHGVAVCTHPCHG